MTYFLDACQALETRSWHAHDDERPHKGFTLMEMLIVVAIIAILVAIAIPVFTAQLNNARLATDAANLRSVKAEAAIAVMSDSITVDGAPTTVSKLTAPVDYSGWVCVAADGSFWTTKAKCEASGKKLMQLQSDKSAGNTTSDEIDAMLNYDRAHTKGYCVTVVLNDSSVSTGSYSLSAQKKDSPLL